MVGSNSTEVIIGDTLQDFLILSIPSTSTEVMVMVMVMP